MELSLNEIRSIIDKADQIYYYSGRNFIPDATYDEYKSILREQCPDDPRLARVGAPLPEKGHFAKVPHGCFMGSLDNSNNLIEFSKWYDRCRGGTVLGSPKVDGSSIAIEYKDGNFVRAITRGDGTIGQDISRNAIRFMGVPTQLPQPINCYVRGEAVLKVSDWAIVDPDMTTNPRNVGNGIVVSEDGEDSEYITFIAFDFTGDRAVNSEEDKIKVLEGLGFIPVPNKHCEDINKAIDYYNEVLESRENMDFWIDGVVFKISDCTLQTSLGMSSGRPRGQTAFKFPAISGVSVLESVELTVGHTGAVIPTGKIRPVKIGGTTVSSVLLNNFREIEALGLAIGDEVEVIKAGDIIPKLTRVINKPTNRTLITTPTTCPVCGGEVGYWSNVDGEDSVSLYCMADQCEAKISRKVERWIKSLDILGIGPAVLGEMSKSGLVRDPGDLYAVTESQLANLIIGKSGKLGETRAAGIISEINKKRELTIDQFVGSLGVRFLGKDRVALIREKCPGSFDDIERWLDSTIINKADDAGLPNIAATIHENLLAMEPIIRKLLTNGVTIKMGETTPTPTPASGAFKFVLTGTLSEGRKAIHEQIEAAGHIAAPRVASDVDYLVAADPNSGSSKLQKAAKMGIKVISEDEMRKIIG